MMDKGADAAMINRVMFDTKSRARLEIEAPGAGYHGLYFGGKCAVAYVTRDMVLSPPKASDEDRDGIAALPRQVEGGRSALPCGKREDSGFKISVRTSPEGERIQNLRRIRRRRPPGAAGCVLAGRRHRGKASDPVGDSEGIGRTGAVPMNGIIVIDKPQRFTSDVVAMRGLCGTKRKWGIRALYPMVTGVLRF